MVLFCQFHDRREHHVPALYGACRDQKFTTGGQELAVIEDARD